MLPLETWVFNQLSWEKTIEEDCCGNHSSYRPIITQAANLSVGYQVGITRELNKESPLYCYPIYTITCGLCYNYTSTVHPTLKSICYP